MSERKVVLLDNGRHRIRRRSEGARHNKGDLSDGAGGDHRRDRQGYLDDPVAEPSPRSNYANFRAHD